MKYLAKSAEVLNEADRFQQMLDWELFTSAQDIQLWHSQIEDVTWRPGDLMFRRPDMPETCDREDCGWCADYRQWQGHADMEYDEDYEGNCVRPMIQEYDLTWGLMEGVRSMWNGDECNGMPATCYINPICCDVWWDRYKEADCWVCGAEFPLLEKFSPKKLFGNPFDGESRLVWEQANPPLREALGFVQSTRQDANGFVVEFRLHDWASDAFRAMQEAARQGEEAFRRMYMSMPRRNGLSALRQYMDEYIAFDIDFMQFGGGWGGTGPRWSVEPFHEPVGRSFHNPYIDPPSPLTRPNIRGPIWGWAALYDPNDEPAPLDYTQFVNGFLLPGWRDYQPEIPIPNVPASRALPDRAPTTGPPTTLDRRRREVP